MTRIIKNEDVRAVKVEIPEGHQHIRTTVVLSEGEELIFQEATISNILRAFITVKTHPVKKSIKLKLRKLKDKKEGYAQWQLMEEE